MGTFDLSRTFDANKLSAVKKDAYAQLTAQGPKKYQQSFLKANYPKTQQKTDFEKQGFPEETNPGPSINSMVNAFIQTANVTNSVISTRVPGGATTRLINEGYDLKGYFIKSKSCNWGPMSGFLCRHPAFNKKGASGIGFNSKYISVCKDYYEKLLGVSYSSLKFAMEAFVPLKISEEQRIEILKNKSLCFSKPDKSSSPTKIYGMATDYAVNENTKQYDHTLATVVMEYVMKKDATNGLWNIYFGKVYFRLKPTDQFKEYKSGENNKFADVDGKPFNLSSILAQHLASEMDTPQTGLLDTSELGNLATELNSRFGITRLSGFNDWHTVDGIRNPYPAYDATRKPADQDNLYKNAVTGDYDLFAVWPIIPPADMRELIRISEVGPSQAPRDEEYTDFEKLPSDQRRYLIPVIEKPLSLELARSRDVFMEFVPGFDPIKILESKRMGNYNDAVYKAAATLNSMAMLEYPSYSRGNVAFHSDEGGRPGVNDIEYPVAFFLPEDFANWCGLNSALLIGSHAELLALINFVQGQYYITLNWGWLIHMFMMVQDLQNLTNTGNKYISERLKEFNKLPQPEKDYIDKALKDLFVPMSQRTINTTTDNEAKQTLPPEKIKANQKRKTTADTKQQGENNTVYAALKEKFLAIAKKEQPTGYTEPGYLFWKGQFEQITPVQQAQQTP